MSGHTAPGAFAAGYRGRGSARVAVTAMLLFLGAWAVLHVRPWSGSQIRDTPVYQHYGDEILRGEQPYGAFDVEYPPGALPAFVLPAVGHPEGDEVGYQTAFEALMAACGAACVLLVAVALRSLGASRGRTRAVLAFVALTPLALGSVMLSRYDLWPSVLVAGALAALLAGRWRVSFGVLALAFVTKIYPLVLAGPALAYVWRRSGRGEALRCAGVFVAVALACVLPFIVLSPHGVWWSVVRQTTRPLQIESLGAALLLVGHHLGGIDVRMESGHGSQNLVGAGTGAVAAAQTALQAAAITGVWWRAASRPLDRERLVRLLAAALVAFVCLGKVLSPQFLVWLIALVPLVGGRRGLAASALLGVALVLTQAWFPFRYWDYALELDPVVAWLVLVRDVVLVSLLAVLLWPERGHGPAGSTA